MSKKNDLITTISSPRLFSSLWAPYLCKILRALIPGQKQSAFSIRAVSTVTAHIKAKTVKSQGDVCLSAWERVFERGVCVCVYMEELNQMVIPPLSLAHHSSSSTPPPPPYPNPTLFNLSPAPYNLRAASHGRLWKSEASLPFVDPPPRTSNICFQIRTTGRAPAHRNCS